MTLRTALLACALATTAAVLASSSLMTSASPARAEGGHSFIVPANDGYGLGECLAEGAACGRLVADAWCEAQGFGKAESFGPADPADVTSALAVKTQQASAPRSYTIVCRQ